MMRNVIVSLLLFVGIISVNITSTYAAQVQIYDYSVENIIRNLKEDCARQGIDIWGTDYYTYNGVQRCELNFGNSKNNVIRFRLNNDNSVSRILVTMPNSFTSNNGSKKSFMESAFVNGVIVKSIGLSKSEGYELIGKWTERFKEFAAENPGANYFHEKFSMWCPSIERYIVLDVEMDDSKFDWYFYAHT